MTGFSVDKDGKQTGGLEQWATSLGKMIGSVKGLWQQLETGKKKFDAMNAAAGKSKSSFSDYIKYVSESEDATEAFGIATLYTRARVLLLNMALSTGLALAASLIVKKIAEASQSIETNATKSKEAADAAQSTTSSLKDLVSAYEELGDKSGWDTEDFDQAKDIQAEILDLAKEQGTLDEDKLGKLDLQNGKYEEQLGLLQDITAEQLEASRYELTQNKDAQGDKLVDTAKKNNRTHYLTVWSAPEMDMGDQIKNAGIDIFNKFGGYGPDDLKDADSIVDYYNEVGKALKYVIDNTTEAERAAGGTYHSLYQFLLDEQTALRDDVDSYNDSTDAINNNTNARRELQAVDFWQNDNNNSMDVSFTFDKVNSAVQTLEDTIDGFDASKLNDLLWGTNEGLSDEQAQALANLRKALTDMDFSADTNGVNAFIQALVQVGIVAQSSANGVDAVAQASQKMEDISSEIDEIQTAYKNATTAIDEYNKYGYLSADTLQTLLNEDFEYLSCLELVDGQLQVNTEKYQGMIAAQYQSAAMALVEKANAELAKIAQGEKKDAVEDATKATEDQAAALTERVCPALGEFAKASMTAAAAQEFLANGDAAWSVDPERTKEVYAGLASGLNILDATVDQIMGNSDKFRQHMNGFDKETKNRNKNTAKSVTDVASAFDTLNKAMKEYNQYGYLCADTAKSLVGLDDKFTACLTKQGDKLQINVEQFRKFVKEQLKEANAAKDGGKSADEMKKILNYLDQNVDTTTISFEQLTDAIKGYGTAMDKAKEKTDAIKSAFSGLSEVMNNKTDWSNPFGLLDSDDVEKQHNALMQLAKDTNVFKSKAYNPETGEVDFNSKAFKDSVVEYLNGMADAAAKTGGAGAKAIEKNWRDAAKAIADGKISVEEFYNGLGYSLEKATKEIDDFQSGFSDITDIVDEYNLYGGLSIDNYQKLMALSPEYLSCLKLEGDQLVFNEAAYKQLLIDKLNDMITTYEQTDATKALSDRLRELRDGLLNSKTGFKDAKDAAEEFKSAMSDLKEILSSVLSIFEKFNDKSNNDLKIWGDAMGKVIDKRIEALNKQKEALEENNEATERAIELSKAQDALARAQQQRTTRVYTENGYEWQANAEDVRTAREDLADKQREWNKKDAEKAIDDQIKKYNEFKDKLSEVMDDIGKSWKDYQKELEYTAQIQKMSLSQMEGSLDGYHDKIIASLNTGSAITSIQNLITNLESLINTLTKVNNLYSMLKTGEYKDLGTKGLWNTIKGFFNKGGEEATGESANVVENFFNVLRSKVQTSGNGLVETFSGIWKKIKAGAQSLFNGSGEGSGIVSTVVDGFKAVGNVVSKSKIGSTLIKGAEKLVTGAGGLIKGAVSAIGTAGASAIPVIGGLAAAAGLGIYSGVKGIKHQKEIWSNKEDGFGKKAIKSVASFFWDISPIGGIVNLCKDIFGKSKETAENTKDTANSSSETAENTQKSATNLTINATQIVSKEENKATDETDKKNDATANEDKTVKTAATTLTGAGLGAAAGMAIGGPVGALIGTLLGGFAGFFLGGHANGLKSSKTNHFANVDERGSELIVRKPASGRYTYLETGDGVVPADITSRLFEMGGNPDKWFSDQLAKHSSASMVQSRDAGGISLSIGDVNVNNPVGDSDALARELVNRLPNKVVQELNRR